MALTLSLPKGEGQSCYVARALGRAETRACQARKFGASSGMS
jgi:hypothetical protein